MATEPTTEIRSPETLEELEDLRDKVMQLSMTERSDIAAYLAAAAAAELNDRYESARAFHINFYEDEYDLARIESGVREGSGDKVDRLRKADLQIDEGALPANGAYHPSRLTTLG